MPSVLQYDIQQYDVMQLCKNNDIVGLKQYAHQHITSFRSLLQDTETGTCLACSAVERNALATLTFLVSQGLELEPIQQQLLEFASSYKTPDVLSFLLHTLEYTPIALRVALRSAIQRADIQGCQQLLKAGADFDDACTQIVSTQALIEPSLLLLCSHYGMLIDTFVRDHINTTECDELYRAQQALLQRTITGHDMAPYLYSKGCRILLEVSMHITKDDLQAMLESEALDATRIQKHQTI